MLAAAHSIQQPVLYLPGVKAADNIQNMLKEDQPVIMILLKIFPQTGFNL
jgi:hypothetical protein